MTTVQFLYSGGKEKDYGRQWDPNGDLPILDRRFVVRRGRQWKRCRMEGEREGERGVEGESILKRRALDERTREPRTDFIRLEPPRKSGSR